MADQKKEVKITPMDIHDKEFKRRGRNGYDRYEVDSFLDQIVDDYGNALDLTVDLKNQIVSLNAKVADLNSQIEKYQEHEAEVDKVLASAQKTATKIKQEAEDEAQDILADAEDQANTDTKYAEQQKKTITEDYERLKAEVGQFRQHMQEMLQKQIDGLNDEEWQKALDKYFDTPRYYPEDGSEPLANSEDFDDDIDDEDLEDIDEDDEDDVESDQELDENQASPQPMTGDSPSHQTISQKEEPEMNSSAPTIVFPDDYKDHN